MRRLRHEARRRDISLAGIVRDAVDQVVPDEDGSRSDRIDALLEVAGSGRSQPLVTHAYVVVETLAVARRRFGAMVAADIIDRVLPAIEVAPVDAGLHASGGSRRSVSPSIRRCGS